MPHPEHDNASRRVGLGMLAASFALGLVVLTLFFDGVLSNQINPNRNPASLETADGVREVALERNRQGHYVTTGTVNGVTATFLLDTGATDVAIPANVAQQAGLQQGYASQASTANGIVTVYNTRVDELSVGNIVFEDLRASITPSMFGDTVLLGMSALRQVEFTQRGTTLTLRQYPE